MSFTPGTWEYVFVTTRSPWKDSSTIRHREGGQEIIIARVFDKPGSFDNARLIAAAPEMLELLRKACLEMDNALLTYIPVGEDGNDMAELVGEIEALLDRIEGEEGNE